MNFEALIKVLESETKIYKELLELEKGKTNILIEGDVGKLDKIMNTEQVINMKIGSFEKKRISIMDELGLHDKTLKQVITIAKNDERKTRSTLFGIYKELKECTDRLREVNEQNSTLIKARLNVIEGLSNCFKTGTAPKKDRDVNLMKKNNTYDKNAKVISQMPKDGERTIKKRI